MDEEEGEGERPGDLTERGEDGGDFGGVVFVGPLESDVGVQDEEAGAVPGEGGPEALDGFRTVDTQAGLEDEIEFEGVEGSAPGLAEVLDALADVQGGVLGGVDEDGSGVRDGEASQAGAAGGDGDGELEGEPALAGLGGSTNDADGA
jgi:hypothetical protein